MELRLQGKVALVTGAARNIGAAIAAELHREGCEVFLTDIDEAGIERQCERLGAKAHARRLDVRERADIEAGVAHVVARCGRLDILVNNAGIFQVAPLLEIEDEDAQNLVATNFLGVYRCCRAVLPTMSAQRYGKIVNIASVSAFKGGGAVGTVLYGASKAAVAALTQGVAREAGRHGINVNAIAPGLIGTGIAEEVFAAQPEVEARVRQRFPVGRLGTTEDIATLTAFLASDVSAFMNGAVVVADGGFLTT